MTKSKRSVLLSVLTLVLCLALVAGGTYALFSDEVIFSDHLQAGKLDISLFRTKLVKNALDGDGFLVSNANNPDTRRLNYSDKNDENVFGFGENEKIVPGSEYIATFEIENKSDVAFGYWVEIICKDKKDGEDLAKQVQISVTPGNAEAFIGEGLVVKGANGVYIDVLAIDDVKTFTVTIKFLDSAVDDTIDDNNKAQGELIYFDLIVKAEQVTEAP